ncbi:hypothetical protein BLNAU_8794 [Blattamonas nauphoetae]|uniref:Transcription initiation factor TFIID subunit 13 n=1 Tax=Blattamonas nauphoetae TaxID=2049346 RepID=A0ABQ9XXM2_9EUKA|nr:hypothetical protein BLNAU_8794 [Blattamonas nauphoetae]
MLKDEPQVKTAGKDKTLSRSAKNNLSLYMDLLYAFGDVEQPLVETAITLQDCVNEYLADFCTELASIKQVQQQKITTDHIIALSKRDRKKHFRALELVELVEKKVPSNPKK